MCFSGNGYDEDELERELEELEQEELDEHLLSVRTDEHTLPDVPNGDVKIPNAATEPNKKSMSLLAHWSLHQWRIKNVLFIKNNFSFFFLVPSKKVDHEDDINELLAWAN